MCTHHSTKNPRRLRRCYLTAGLVLLALSLMLPAAAAARNLAANVVAFDMPLMWNRLGAQNINGEMFALRRDVVLLNPVNVDGVGMVPAGTPLTDPDLAGFFDLTPDAAAGLAGNVTLRPDKRPRPLVLRTGAGDQLTITLTNLLAPPDPGLGGPFNPPEVRSGIPFNLLIDNQVADRRISLRFQGTQLVGGMNDDGTFVGTNADSLLGIGNTATSTIRTPKENAYVGTSYGATIGGEGLGGSTSSGLFAVLNVNPVNSSFYRSQLTEEEMRLASAMSLTPGDLDCGVANLTAGGHPIIDYEALYPAQNCDFTVSAWVAEGKSGLPIINMVAPKAGFDGEIVHSDINSITAYGPDLEMVAAPNGPFINRLGHFPKETYPLESKDKRNPTVPNRLEPFREFTIAFHDEVTTKQAFPQWFEDPVLRHTLHGVRDSFMVNYGSGGIGTEIIASRLGVGPMHDCINCAYEEFFLTFFAVGEVGQLVDIPANVGLENCGPDLNPANCAAVGPKANFVLFPDDPSNVHHSYTGDFTKFRNIHAGPGEQHIFHLHNHQWLFNANDDNSNYLDAQGIGPGSGYTYEINFGGSGNRNKTAGDAIFHCHFYPHFAQGMWEMWRSHDTFETGTELMVSANPLGVHLTAFGLLNGTPGEVDTAMGFLDTDGTRALPDGEIVAGAPTPALVPLPGKAMAPMPAGTVNVTPNPNMVAQIDPGTGMPTGMVPTGSLSDVQVIDSDADGVADNNPGYPFWIAGMEHSVGQRPTTPPLDMITQTQAANLKTGDSTTAGIWQHPGFNDLDAIDGWDGGLPRFTLDGKSAGGETVVAITRLDFSKEITKAKPFFFPEEGTALEKGAMAYHAIRQHPSFISDGTGTTGADFILNGALPVPGAPFQEPCVDDQGDLMAEGVTGDFFDADGALTTHGKSPHNATDPRVYKGANVQFDAVFNKLGYHYPQQRIITLWQDVVPTINKERPPEPFVLRNNTFDCTQYVHSNVVPKVFELDDYQVRTPTDIIGQHIHMPKWDLTTADGAANGWNYEDGTLSPGMVQEVIEAINAFNGSAVTPVTTNVEGDDVVASNGRSLSTEGTLLASAHPFFGLTAFGGCPDGPWCGARSTMQRWFFDPVVNVQGVDRGLGIIFTHDHYGPSTHQQIGLYATVLVEPAGSKWVHNETGQQLGQSPDGSPAEPGRTDGGPTSWQAAILTGSDGFSGQAGQDDNVGGDLVENHREFYLEYSDFQHAYQFGVYVGADDQGFPLNVYTFADANGDGINDNQLTAGQGGQGPGGAIAAVNTFREAIQPSVRLQAPLVNGFPVDIWEFAPECPNIVAGVQVPGVSRPCPEAISADDPGMYTVNYRNESLVARVFDPARTAPDGKLGAQTIAEDVGNGTFNADGTPAGAPDGVIDEFEAVRGDLAHAMWSGDEGSPVPRAIPALNTKLGLAPATYAGNPAGCDDGTGNTVFCPPINQLSALLDGDPFTPMMRALDRDSAHVKIQNGATEEEHADMAHGIKWLQAGSGFGEAKNSGWRNAQSAGISEQFSFRMPVFADINQRGNGADYFYTTNAAFEGYVSGNWGIVRSTSNNTNGLFELPGNAPKNLNITNDREFVGVCPEDPAGGQPVPANLREYDVTAVLAEDVLPAPAGVTVQDNFGSGTHEGRAPDGGTLVYNSRNTPVAPGGAGPLHDPTAILYFFTDDLVFDPAGVRTVRGDPIGLQPGVPVEPLVLRANAGDCIEVTLRNALLAQAQTLADDGVTLIPVFDAAGNPVFVPASGQFFADLNGDASIDLLTEQVLIGDVQFDQMPDLATGSPINAMVRRDPGVAPAGMTSFQTNLMAPSPYAGLHAALVEFDVTRDDGAAVGQNGPGQNIAAPGGTASYRWYAGHIESKFVSENKNRRNIEIVATPIEFGGFNLMAADRIEQPQKGMLGAGVIYPQGAEWTVDGASGPFVSHGSRNTNTSATVDPTPGGLDGDDFRDFTTVAQKGASMFYADSLPVENILGEGTFGVGEDSQDMGQMAINYGTEPLWFRFGVNPTDAGGNAGAAGKLGAQANAGNAYSNELLGTVGAVNCVTTPTDPACDPQTAVFTADADQAFRQHVLMPSGPGRGSTFDLHGHVWQRDPYVCPDSDGDGLGLSGKCDMGNGHAGAAGTGEVGSQNLGVNPIGFSLGGIESWFAGQHYEIVIPSAGGENGVEGDYLFRDHMGLGNSQGLWGIVRVEAPPPAP